MLFRSLNEIKVPTLVVHGTEDAILPLDHGIAVADGITDSKRMIMDGVGHEIPEELLPEIINEIIANVKKSEKQQKEEIQKSIRDLDHMVRDVRAYFQRIKQRSRTAGERQKSDLRLESMIPFVVEKKKIFIHADEARQIK